ncbi:24876_t:CDS:2, partial [Gigaspora margarita]
YEDLVWSDQDIDKRASDYFAVLLMASKNKNIWKPSSRPSTYVGGSKRTQRRKKAELKKAAQYTRPIATYFAPALTEIAGGGISGIAGGGINNGMLKTDNNKMDKGIRVRLQASLQYLRLRYQGQTRIGASTTIAKNYDKFMKVFSLLDDERISIKALKQKQPYVRKQHGDGLENWDSNKDIPPEEKQHCMITHDKTTLSANDDEKTGWGLEGYVLEIGICDLFFLFAN